MKRKIAMIQPYFGRLPNYFHLGLQTYAHNEAIDWYIFTDDRTPYDFPPNVFVIYTTLDRLKSMFQQKFAFPIALERPYKLCDYKPAYGHLFSDHVKGYDFWGHFDPDVIFGNLAKFIPEAIREQYDKLCVRGHFSLYRNNPIVNLLYQQKVPDCLYYETVLASERNWGFGERNNGVNAFFAASHLRVYNEGPIADIYFRDYAMRRVGQAEDEKQKSRYSCFAYEHGGVYRYYWLDGEVRKEEFMYIHLMRREMSIHCTDERSYLIYQNGFRKTTPVTLRLLRTANRGRFYYRLLGNLKYAVYTRNLKPALRILLVERKFGKFFAKLGEKTRPALKCPHQS